MSAWPIVPAANCVFFALGRNAMYAACLAVGVGPGDEVLTPAFDCAGALQPFRVLGCRLRFVRSDPSTFAIDVDDLRRRLTPQTKLVHIINHFGMPQPWEELLALRAATGVPILEDNAYSLFSSHRGRPFGTFGDLAIFSLRKELPLPQGGLLRVNNLAYAAAVRETSRRATGSTGRNAMQLVKSGLGYQKLPMEWRWWLRRRLPMNDPPPPLPSDPAAGVPAWPLRDAIGPEFSCDYLRPISRWARTQLSRLTLQDYQAIADLKRQLYASLVRSLASVDGIRVLWPELPDGIVPWGVSVLVNAGRDEMLERLRGRYPVMAWPTLPQAVIDQLDDFPDVEWLGRRLLQLPLSADAVRLPGFGRYARGFVDDVRRLVTPTLVPVG